MPTPQTPEQCNELFNRTGKQMGVVFSAARQLGVKTCVGTEPPLTIPTADIEYQIIAARADGTRICWPATAPELNQSVVVTD